MGPSSAGLRERLSHAQDLARSVGRTAMEFRRNADREALSVTTKGVQDFVTIADKRAEQAIRSSLGVRFPTMDSLARRPAGV